MQTLKKTESERKSNMMVLKPDTTLSLVKPINMHSEQSCTYNSPVPDHLRIQHHAVKGLLRLQFPAQIQ